MMVSVLLRLKASGILDEYANLAAYVTRGGSAARLYTGLPSAIGSEHRQAVDRHDLSASNEDDALRVPLRQLANGPGHQGRRDRHGASEVAPVRPRVQAGGSAKTLAKPARKRVHTPRTPGPRYG